MTFLAGEVMEPSMLVEKLNYSLIQTMGCMKRTLFHLQKPDMGEPNYFSPPVIGQDMHRVVELYILMYNDTENNHNNHLKLTHDMLMSRGNVLSKLIYWDKVKPIIDKYISWGIRDIERKELVKLGGVPWNGVQDLVMNDGTIIDHKFVLKPWNDWKLNDYTSLQAYPYFGICQEIYGEKPHKLIFNVVPLMAEPVEHIVICDHDRLEREIRGWKAIWARLKAAEKMDMWPAEPSATKCKYCNYRELCDRAV